jgi:hypothetical protein
MPAIIECEAMNCVYNKGLDCHALAINVGGATDECPKCDTFFQADSDGGEQLVIGTVGACKVGRCKFNKMFECLAEAVFMRQHGDHVDCATFEAL